MPFHTVRVTNTPAIKNAPIEGLAEGNGAFSNYHLAALVIVVPWFVKRMLPIVNRGGFKTYIFMVIVCGLPVTMGYWTLMSMYGPRKNNKVVLPERNLEEYITIHDEELKKKYHGKEKIPMQVFHDAYFDGRIDFNGTFCLATRPGALADPDFALASLGDVLDIMEQRHDWAKMVFTLELFKYVFFNLIPDVIRHTENQDTEQVRDHYDREHRTFGACSHAKHIHVGGDDFYEWFLGPRMVYTSGIITDITVEESLEQLQDNKMTVVCEKVCEPCSRVKYVSDLLYS